MPPAHPPVTAAWAFASTHGTTTYETLLYSDGTLSCNCPGWVFRKADQPRGCRHTREAEPFAARLLSGQLTPEAVGAVRPATTPRPSPTRRRPAVPRPTVNPLTGRLRRHIDLD